MPLSARARQDGAENKERMAKSQEQELKRARGAISCAECRRLKLKCDKTVPCSSCKRRGCSSICPNGSLTTGQGTRFILADTDRLHRKIAEMSDRIRQLEDGLAILQSSATREPHPLLAADLLKIKSGLELHAASELGATELQKERSGGGGLGPGSPEEEEEPAYIDAFGTLAVRDDGAATFYGRSAGSESLLLDDKPQLSISTLAVVPNGHSDLPPEINQLTTTFPHGPPEVPVYDLQDLMSGYLPPWPRAVQLRHLYLEQAPWFFGAVTQRQLYEEVFPLFYEEAQEELRLSGINNGALGSSAEAFNLPQTGAAVQHASSHELALMFVVFCFGALTDPTLPPAPHNAEAARYYQLTRAALSLEPVMDRPPSVATVQVLSLMGIYMGMVSDDRSIECTWSLMGLSSKLAQSTGLHRDCARFKLSAAETQKRRALFWELFITDCWQALATGRLPTFELQFVDAELPADPDETLADDGTPQPSFPAWKARWGKECVSAVVMGTLTAQPPKYSVILELDRRIRDMALPKYAQGPPPQNAGLGQTMSHYMPTNYLHLTLLYVHRCYFATALNDHPDEPMRSQYAPSFLAGYRSATALLGSIREQFSIFPVQIARFWVLWTHAFSACVMLGSVVTRGCATKTAQAAMSELRIACDLFERASQLGGRATKFVPPLRKLQEKAQAAYFKSVQPLRKDIFSPRSAESEQQDELSIFSGRTARTVATKSNRPQRVTPNASTTATPTDMSSPATSNAGSASASGAGAGAGSDPNANTNTNTRSSQSPGAEVFPGLDSSYRTAVHPGLVAELRQFEGQIDAQIDHANVYYNNNSSNNNSGQLQQQQTQHLYAEQHPQYQEQHQHQQQQAGWHQNNVPVPVAVEHQHQHQHQHQQHHYSASPPTAQAQAHGTGTPEQLHPYAYAQSQPHSQQQQHTPEEHHTPEYAYHHAAVAAVPDLHNMDPHSIPMYGGAHLSSNSNANEQPSNNGTSQYEDHPYAHVAASAASSSANAYPAYATHSVPDQQQQQRSELWSVNATPADGGVGVPPSYPTSPVYDPTTAQAPVHAQEHAHGHGHGHGHVGQNGQPHYPQYHSSADPHQPLQPQHTGQVQTHYTGQGVAGQHAAPIIQVQHTGNAGQAIHPQHTGQMQQQHAYTQDQHQHPQYGYGYSQQQQQQQPQMMMPPPPPQQPQLHQLSAAPYHVQPGSPYSLTETWTSFIQHEVRR